MVAKILGSSSTYNGVHYNTDKALDREKAELTAVKNFGYMEAISNPKPQDIKNYLLGIASKNSRVKNSQFHAVISCKAKEYNKEQLTEIASVWMDKMGYGKQPYIIMFHKDTENNHVHIVSTRVDQDSYLKIDDTYEKIRAVRNINSIMQKRDTLSIDLDKAHSFNFSSEAQFSLLLEKMGYVVKREKNVLQLIKDGEVKKEIERKAIQDLAKEKKTDTKRASQIRAIIEKYRSIYNSEPISVFANEAGGRKGGFIGYESELSVELKKTFGIDLVFHGNQGQQPYGYTVIDNANKNVYKGGEIFSLKSLIDSKLSLDAYWLVQRIDILRRSGQGLKDLDELLDRFNLTRDEEYIYQNDKLLFTLDNKDLSHLASNELLTREFITHSQESKEKIREKFNIPPDKIVIDSDCIGFYQYLMSASISNYPTFNEGLDQFGLTILKDGREFYLFDTNKNYLIELSALNNPTISDLLGQKGGMDDTPHQHQENEDSSLLSDFADIVMNFDVMINSDVDDEATHGRKRKKMRKAKTNTR